MVATLAGDMLAQGAFRCPECVYDANPVKVELSIDCDEGDAVDMVVGASETGPGDGGETNVVPGVAVDNDAAGTVV